MHGNTPDFAAFRKDNYDIICFLSLPCLICLSENKVKTFPSDSRVSQKVLFLALGFVVFKSKFESKFDKVKKHGISQYTCFHHLHFP